MIYGVTRNFEIAGWMFEYFSLPLPPLLVGLPDSLTLNPPFSIAPDTQYGPTFVRHHERKSLSCLDRLYFIF